MKSLKLLAMMAEHIWAINMLTFGLTGSIATGKSNITNAFRRNDIQMIDADILARELMAPGQRAYDEVNECFGNWKGYSDRLTFAKFIFETPNALAQLNRIMFPHIRNETVRRIKEFEKRGEKIVGFDCALIIEMGDANRYYPLIVVSCTLQQQVERLIKRLAKKDVVLTEQEAMLRINAQLLTEEKVKHADLVIDTNQSKEETLVQVQSIIKRLRQLKRT